MPELTVTHIALLVLTTIVGAVVGWILRGRRSEQEKAAVSAGWQEQIDAQRREHERLVEQNKTLMEQVSQFQAQHTDAKNRAKELSLAVQEAFERRDALQREIKDVRGNLETALSERDQLASSMQAQDATSDLLQQKDDRIARLSKELENWQNRLPPLIERFRVRNEEAERLEAELAEAQERIRELELRRDEPDSNQTRIEPVSDPEELTDGLDASNDPADDFTDPAVVHTFTHLSTSVVLSRERAGQGFYPAIDPLSYKNRTIRAEELTAILCNAGLGRLANPNLADPFPEPAQRLQPDGTFGPAYSPERIGFLLLGPLLGDLLLKPAQVAAHLPVLNEGEHQPQDRSQGQE